MNEAIDKKHINVDDRIRLLRKKFLRIRSFGYIESVRNGTTGIGTTFEALLGKEEDKLENPDFMGIEIKTRRAYSKSLINLFNAAPYGASNCEVRRIRDKYGYPDKNDRSLKQFMAKIGVLEKVKVGLFYKFQLKVDRECERLILCVYDWNDVCVDDSTYWDFNILKEKLIRKLSILALIKAWTNKINGKEHFKYYKMDVYILRDFDAFIQALEDGYVQVAFKIGNNYCSDRYGKVEAHGVGFAISEENLDKVFELYR